ncbi:MAG: hypothetical protein AAFW46_10385 [Pseudomonadota bacterium]
MPEMNQRLAQLAAAGVATHAVTITPPERSELDALLGVSPDTEALKLLAGLCDGHVSRLGQGVFALDAAGVGPETLAQLPEALGRRLFGPGSAHRVALTEISTAAPSPEKAIDWAACEVRIEDMAADLDRRMERAVEAGECAREAIGAKALEAIDALKTRSAEAIEAVAEAAKSAAPQTAEIAAEDAARVIAERIDNRLEDTLDARIAAVIERVGGGVAEADLAGKIERLTTALDNGATTAESIEARRAEIDALKSVVGALQDVVSGMRARASEVSEVSSQIDTLRAAFGAGEDQAAQHGEADRERHAAPEADLPAAEAPRTSDACASAAVERIAQTVAPFGSYALSLDAAPLIPGELSWRDVIAHSKDAAGLPG